jgi:hypothetical protein
MYLALKLLTVVAIMIAMVVIGPQSLLKARADQQSTVAPYLIIRKAVIQQSGLNAAIFTGGTVPKDGSGKAFGYGILTDQFPNAVIVSTTHEGVRDSVTQGRGSGPIWHNHFVRLGHVVGSPCGNNPEMVEVLNITYQQPGRIAVEGNLVALEGVPPTIKGTDALHHMAPLVLSPGHKVTGVVSFTLDPKMQGNRPHVCVENIRSAQPQDVIIN